MSRSLLPWLLGAIACGGGGSEQGPSAPPVQDPSGGVVRLAPEEHLVRASIALRGLRPTVAELDAVRADPAQLEVLVNGYAQSAEFGLTIKDMWAEILLLRNDTFLQLPALAELEGYNLNQIYQSTTNEPLELISRIVMDDRPFTDIVTSQSMYADEVVAKMYGVPYDFDSPEVWQETWWGDERPVAGILSSAQLWRRWESNGSNFHRGRANLVARELLCEDFDHRDILVAGGINIADEAAVAYAVRTQPACVGCHAALDPLAGYFWGYKQLIHRNFVGQSINAGCEWDWSNGAQPEFGPSYLYEYYCYPLQQYNVADEFLYAQWGLPEPNYYGTPAKDLAEVGQLIADDPRFSECQARQFFGYYAQIDPNLVPADTALALQADFEASGFDAKALAVQAVLHPSFAVLRSDDPAAPLPPHGGLHAIRPEQYARIVAQLTGYRWWAVADQQDCDAAANNTVQVYGTQCWETIDLSDSDLYGFRAMAGGVDGQVVTRPIHTATPTKMLAIEALASDAAGFVVSADFAAAASERRLLGLVEAGTTDEAAIRAQLVALHAAVLGERVGAAGPEVDLSYALWATAFAAHADAPDAWRVTLIGLLQDPRMLLY